MRKTANKVLFLSLRSSLAALMSALCLLTVQAQLPNYGDISVEVVLQQDTSVGNGYGEYRALVTNHSANQSHRVAVVLLFGTYGAGDVREIRREVEVAPQAKANISMFVPMLENAYIAEVSIDGKRQTEQLPITNRIGVLDSGDRSFGLLLSPKIFKSGVTAGSKFEEAFKNSDGDKIAATQSLELPVTEWSSNWLSYARYDGIMISAEELDSAPEAVKSSLLRYVERGGAMMVMGNWQMPTQWQSRQGFITNDSITGKESDENSGITLITTPHGRNPAVSTHVPPPSKDRTPFPALVTQSISPTDLSTFFIGFGTLIVTGAVNTDQISVNQWNWTSMIFSASRPPILDYYTIANLNEIFPVVERFGVPVRGLFVLMLVFVLVIGPVNLFWLARRRRKIWMLWTVPAISLLTCLIVSGFALFGEGWSATAKTEALTILDETAHRATTIGLTAFYSPVTPSEGLHFSYDTELDPQIPRDWRYGRNNAATRTIDWTNDQHLDSGWISARVPAFFKFRKSETRRERLNLRLEANGTATLVNGLGAEISEIWWADSEGRIHTATNVPAGAQATLKLSGLTASASPARLREAFYEDWLKQFESFTQDPKAVLTPNSYLAVLNASPFVEEGLSNIKTRKARNLVYGIQSVH